MAISCFDDKTHQPGPDELREALGRATARWEQIVAHVRSLRPDAQFVWKMATAQSGWSLRAMDKQRNLMYLIPQRGSLLVAVVLSDKAVAAAQAAGLPPHVLAELNGAQRYMEGTGIRLEVKTMRDVEWVKQLLALKLAH